MPKDINLTEKLQDYCHHHFLNESRVLQALRKQTQTMPEGSMQITPLQGQLLGFLVKMTNAKTILEIGTYTGYSSLTMALSLPEEGRIITCDRNVKWTNVAKKYWELAGVSHKITLMMGKAVDSLQKLIQQQETFDLVLIDADKSNYGTYLELSLSLLNPNGVILVDNMPCTPKTGHKVKRVF
ncbi:O-methyltransferase [Candidatus Finniella inopinata]|uniref:Methyltransferase domain-containing protein n=1 Tax=Candidatus Finniella inopinata TaxID=1696036 RepID=A0A4Q7DHZ2_9PROT|nr:class I SAM-dependent methyltransferase [Candidatus Finniella inopinata]RZI46383.1 methyltransferase domain-containing protein [Candidatus Finniella inopinata]